MVVPVAVELGDGRGGVLLVEEVDEGEAAALLRLAILGQVLDRSGQAWTGSGTTTSGQFGTIYVF